MSLNSGINAVLNGNNPLPPYFLLFLGCKAWCIVINSFCSLVNLSEFLLCSFYKWDHPGVYFIDFGCRVCFWGIFFWGTLLLLFFSSLFNGVSFRYSQVLFFFQVFWWFLDLFSSILSVVSFFHGTFFNLKFHSNTLTVFSDCLYQGLEFFFHLWQISRIIFSVSSAEMQAWQMHFLNHKDQNLIWILRVYSFNSDEKPSSEMKKKFN